MTNEDIIRMAREAGLGWDEKYHWYVSGEQLKCFARLVYEATFRDANIAASKTILDAAEALRLAEDLEIDYFGDVVAHNAAAELRRLSAVEAQRGALLEALKIMRDKYGEYACSVCDRADAAIKAVEEGK